MVLGDLKAAMTAAGRTVALSPALPGLFRLAGTWLDFLDTDTITVSDAIVSGGDGDAPLVVAGQATLLGQAADIALTFYPSADDPEQLECLIGWAAPWERWVPGESFLNPDAAQDTAAQALVRGLAVVGAKMMLSTADLSAAPDSAKACGPLPSWLAGRLPRSGFTVIGTTLLPADVHDLLTDLVGPVTLPTCEIAVQVVGNFLVIDAAQAIDAETGLKLAPFGANGPAAAVTRLHVALPVDEWATRPPVAGITLRLALDGAAMDLSLDVDLTGRRARLGATAVEEQEPTLGWFLKSIGATSTTIDLPFDLGTLTLAELDGAFDLAAGRLAGYQALIATTKPLTLIDGHLTLSPSLWLSSANGGAPDRVELRGLWAIGRTQLETVIDPVSTDFLARLPPGQEVDVGGFLAGKLPDFLTADLVILDLEIEGNIKDRSFAAELETEGGFALALGDAALGVSDVLLSVDYENGAFDVSASASVDILGYRAGVRVHVDNREAFVLVGLPSVDLADLAEAALKSLGQPAELGSFVLSDISVWLTMPTGDFAVAAAIRDPIAIASSPSWALEEVRFEASRVNKAVAAGIGAKMVLAGLDITVAAEFKSGSGWHFSGVESTPFDIAALAADLLYKVGVTVPASIAKGIVVETLSVDYWTKTNALKLGCTGSLMVHGTKVGIGLTLDIVGRTVECAGRLTVGAQTFELDFATGGGTTLLKADWTGRVTFSDLAAAFQIDLGDLQLPSDLEPTLTEVGFGWDGSALALTISADGLGQGLFATVKTAAGRQYALTLTLGKDIRLTDLPELGTLVPEAQSLVVSNVHLQLSSAIDGAAADEINRLLPPGVASLPAGGIAKGIRLGADIQVAGDRRLLELPVPAPPPPPAGAKPAPTPAAGLVKWFSINRSFGPIEVKRLGFSYRNKVLSFLVDGGFSTAVFELELKGLSVGSPLTKFEPVVALAGLELGLSAGPLTLAGFFENAPVEPPVEFLYEGGFALEIENFGLAGMGMYGRSNGNTSLFLFAELRVPMGGPPYFVVDGMLGGFGFNTRLRMPKPEEVYEFPLVRGLIDPGAVGGKMATPMAAMDSMMGQNGKEPWLTLCAGEYWGAAGVEFTTFEMLETHALLLAQFGVDFQLRLLGLSRMQFPSEGGRTYLYVELGTEAEIDLEEGMVAVVSMLSPNSYLIDPSCRLTGGFAMALWFMGEHEGDFVLTLGGYHPAFKVPARYPLVPPLGVSWKVSDSVSITGETYFALTPACMMAGMKLSVVFHAGDLQAWLTAHADMVAEWAPFHFEASIGISVGVSYRLRMMSTAVTFAVEVGADLDLWGPPTGGTVHIHCWVISFNIGFGTERQRQDTIESWSGFAPLLPDADKILSTAITAGLSAQDRESGDWTVRGDVFAFTTESMVPASRLALRLPSAEPRVLHSGEPLSIRPMGITGKDSAHTLSIERSVEGRFTVVDPLAEGWQVESRRRNVAAALWGSGDAVTTVPTADDMTLDGRLAGLSVAAPRPRLGKRVGEPIGADTLSYTEIHSRGTFHIAKGPTGPVPAADPAAVAKVRDTIASAAAVARRREILDAMAGAGLKLDVADDTMSAFSSKAAMRFGQPPLIAA